ncbi:MMPL family transporter [Piscinibacter defluvii]|uniref:MMPL family transporter n=1 Tax=Piscinibacter defluvii TaxID=1796922 RepID=UPI000FDD59F7|nr:MMPL family transporter [Piscinibacter defluvii]
MTGAPLSTRQRAARLLLWAALVLAALLQITRTSFTADLSAFLPEGTEPRQRALIEQLRSGVPARTLMLGIEGGDATQRAAASRRLAAALRASGLFEQVSNGENDAWSEAGQWLFERRYALSPAVTPERFGAAGLRDAIDETVSLLGTPAGAAVRPLLDRDPTGETLRIAEGLIPARAPRSEQGVWVARQGGRALLLAIVRAPGADLDAQALAIERIRHEFAPLAREGLTLLLSGTPRFAVDSRAQIEREVHWLAAAGTLLMGALLVVAFASPAALLVALIPVASGVLAGIAAVSLAFGQVHGVTLGFGSTLIGEAVDYAIYYLIQTRGQGGTGWRRWLASGWPTVRLGLLTSVCGFAALLFSGFPGLAQLGVFSIAGLLGAALATRLALPALMPDGARGMGARRQLGRAARAGVAWLPRTRWLWPALGMAAAVLLWQRPGLWEAELSSLSPIPPQELALEASLRAELASGEGGGLVVVQGGDAETVLQRAETAAARLETLVDRRVLAGFDSITRVLPSVATQRARLASLPEPAALRTALADATRGGPLRAERLEPFVAAVAAARHGLPETPQSLRGTPVAPLVDALLTQGSDGTWTALLPLQPVGAALDTAAVQQALAGLPDTQLLDIGSELRRMYTLYLHEAGVQALLGGLGVLLLIAAALRDPRRVLATCEPLALAVLLTVGGLAALGQPLGILHLVGLLLVVAVGSNYALFFDLLRGRPADDDTLASLALANLTTVLSFALLALSDIPALSAIGRVVAPGALLALLIAAACAPKPPARL